ncbi:hypothetical protein VSDG_07806 [Cytospora chrysosperma]|uniref:Uncharacterized protein n=1 Tax=Cytospora chrysosperma TaxID=252740 RepID=A0A423VJW4_CYTCH|nr:hypothetical protein VSDG_07806 [Valsa sordida]
MDASTLPIMLNLTSQLPVSPPPDHQHFFKPHPNQTPAAVSGLVNSLTNPLLFQAFAKQMEGPTIKEPSLLEKHLQEQQRLLEKQKKHEAAHTHTHTHAPSSRHPGTPAASPTSPSTDTSSQDTKVPPQHSSSPDNLHQNFDHAGDPTAAVDPKYVQMVTRMAAYYQQRCQAILNFQQQRCQTWATSHRQKCQEMMQAAMLVVAWYMRDRIGRRRRRQRRSFRRGLREKNGTAAARRVLKGEVVRKWVIDIPDAALSPNNGMRDEGALDKEEEAFDVEKEVTPDKDSQLFAVADQMIKSQMSKIDIPLLGALNLDESDSESDSDDDDRVGARYYYENEDYEEEGEEEEDAEIDDDDLEYEDETEEYLEDEVSKEALHGTGMGSLKRKRSESDIDTEQVGITLPDTKRILKT